MFTLNVNVILLYRAYLITFSFSQMAIDKFNSELKVSTTYSNYSALEAVIAALVPREKILFLDLTLKKSCYERTPSPTYSISIILILH